MHHSARLAILSDIKYVYTFKAMAESLLMPSQEPEWRSIIWASLEDQKQQNDFLDWLTRWAWVVKHWPSHKGVTDNPRDTQLVSLGVSSVRAWYQRPGRSLESHWFLVHFED